MDRYPLLILNHNLIAKHSDFSGLDKNFVKTLCNELERHYKIFSCSPSLDFIGTSATYKQIRKRAYNMKKAPSYNALMAAHWTGQGVLMLTMNINNFNPEEYENEIKILKSQQEDKFHPLNCPPVEAIIHHELGHILHYYINGKNNDRQANNDDFIVRVYRHLHSKKNPEPMTQAVSRYANQSISEFIAEAWAEYMTSPEPRETATIIGDRLVKLYVNKAYYLEDERKEAESEIKNKIREYREQVKRKQGEITPTTAIEKQEQPEEAKSPTPEEKTQGEGSITQEKEKAENEQAKPQQTQKKQRPARAIIDIHNQFYFDFSPENTPTKLNYNPNIPKPNYINCGARGQLYIDFEKVA